MRVYLLIKLLFAVAVLGFNFLIILSICSAVAKGMSYRFSDFPTLLFMLMILLWFLYLIRNLAVDISRVLLFEFLSIAGASADVFFTILT